MTEFRRSWKLLTNTKVKSVRARWPTPLLLLCAMLLGCRGRPAPLATVDASASSPAPSGAPPEPSAAPRAVVEAPSGTAPPAAEPGPSTAKFERRCGWVDNPTPSNWWLVDRDGEWEIGLQGGYQ